jgi:phage tail-like protein
MAISRPDRPYVQFNFWVTIPGLDAANEPAAGFQEAGNIGTEVTVAEYRNGNDQFNNVRKIVGMNKANDVTLKRGVIGSLKLYEWIDALRNGKQDERTVVIELKSEDREQTVQTWTLHRAKISKLVVGPFNAKGTDVLIEEITIVSERQVIT